jgi:alcohol dehydrogenase
MKQIIKSESIFKKLLRKYCKKNTLIITGKTSFKKSGVEEIFNKFESKKLFFFFKKSYIPEIKELKKIIKLIKEIRPKNILLIGGGAVMDLGKISNFLHNTKNLKKNILNLNYKKQKNFCPITAVPTTAGSGAEVTSNAVIYINKKKYSVEHKEIRPKYFFLHPSLVKKNNKKLKTSSGFDAIAQAVESLISVRSNKKSIEYSILSLKYGLKNYLEYVKKPNSLNSKNMLLAANYSGRAINLTKTTAPHALSYPFTAHFGISHGHAVALTFSDFMKFNFENINNSITDFSLSDRLKILFKLSQTQNLNELIKYFNYIKKSADLEDDFKKLNINVSKNFKLITKDINLSRLSNNPVKVDFQTIKEILLKK